MVHELLCNWPHLGAHLVIMHFRFIAAPSLPLLLPPPPPGLLPVLRRQGRQERGCRLQEELRQEVRPSQACGHHLRHCEPQRERGMLAYCSRGVSGAWASQARRCTRSSPYLWSENARHPGAIHGTCPCMACRPAPSLAPLACSLCARPSAPAAPTRARTTAATHRARSSSRTSA